MRRMRFIHCLLRGHHAVAVGHLEREGYPVSIRWRCNRCGMAHWDPELTPMENDASHGAIFVLICAFAFWTLMIAALFGVFG